MDRPDTDLNSSSGGGDSVGLYKVRVTPRTALTSGSESAEPLVLEPATCAQVRQWIHWPRRCPCCGGESDAYLDVRWSQGRAGEADMKTQYSIRIPYCRGCLNHAQAAARGSRLRTSIGLSVFVATLLVSVPLLSRTAFSMAALLATVAACALGGSVAGVIAQRCFDSRRVRPLLREGCASPCAAVRAGGREMGTHSFLFHRREYAVDFAHMNGVDDVLEVA